MTLEAINCPSPHVGRAAPIAFACISLQHNVWSDFELQGSWTANSISSNISACNFCLQGYEPASQTFLIRIVHRALPEVTKCRGHYNRCIIYGLTSVRSALTVAIMLARCTARNHYPVAGLRRGGADLDDGAGAMDRGHVAGDLWGGLLTRWAPRHPPNAPLVCRARYILLVQAHAYACGCAPVRVCLRRACYGLA